VIEGVLGRVLVAAIAALAIAGCGGGSSHSSTRTSLAGSGGPVSTSSTVRHKPQIPRALIALRAALRKGLRRAGRSSGALVYDLTTGETLFAAAEDVKRPPASVEKLYTTIALLRRLDPDTRLQTVVLGRGRLDAKGTWHGNLYLRGGGDPTFGDGAFNRVWEYGYGPTAAELAAQLRARGIRRVTGRLFADESLFDARRGGPQTAYGIDTPDFGGQLSALTYDHGSATPTLTPAAFAARQLAATLKARHVKVRASIFSVRTPRHAGRLAEVLSPPLSVLLTLMDVPSDDLFAELLTKQLGVRFDHKGTIAAGAHVISDEVLAYGIHPRIVDGSGLSRADASSPHEVVSLLTQIWHTAIGRALARSLPTVGVNGTTRGIATGTAAQGRCIAKTGTLNDVTNLAGYCASRGRHTLAFALFLDGPTNDRAFALIGKMTAAIAKY
jgi:serine-type D-Ala-D-Ala carboxypeptidase/endopeptidase (penicillin-binding protein 4)